MICEILSIGTELLMGQIANTDAQYLSRQLSLLGITVYRQMTVGDNPDRVKEALSAALKRSDIVITTGGLGPTEDDLTKEMVAEVFGLEMALHEPSRKAIKARMKSINHPITENNYKQAYFPAGAIVMPNERGTAPGCIVEQDGKIVAVLPGPPRELIDMFEKQLWPYLQDRSGCLITSRFLRIFGVGESLVEETLKDLFHLGSPTLALYCGAGEVQARLSVMHTTCEDPSPILNPVDEEIRKRLKDAVYAEGLDNTLEKTVLSNLKARGATLSLAESCTGGMLTSKLVDNPGASDALIEAHVTYSNESKIRVLGVREETLKEYGAVSAQCAKEMAEGAKRISASDYAISVTGIAGPDGGSDEKPVGTVFVGIASPDGANAIRLNLRGDRNWIRTLSCQNALNALRLLLLSK